MHHLLVSSALFLPLPNGSFCQVSGQPIFERTQASNLVPDPVVAVGQKRKALLHSGRSRKRQRLADHTSLTPRPPTIDSRKSLKANDVLLHRARIFYAQPIVDRRTTKLTAGLPPARRHLDVLNVSHLHDRELDPDSQGRQVLRKIFPVEYKILPDLFSLSSHRYATTIETCVLKTPKRLKVALPLAVSLCRRHQRCNYRALQAFACPSKLRNRTEDISDSSVVLELMSEIPSRTQLSIDVPTLSASNSTQSGGQPKPRFAEFICTHNEVFNFISLVTRTVIPDGIWGSRHNRRIVLKAVRVFVEARRFETLSLHTVMRGMRTSDCDWLLPESHAARRQRTTLSDSAKKRALVEQLVYWYFNDFVVTLLRTNFYVTESAAYRNRVLYFRQDDWQLLCKPLVDKLKTTTFSLIPPEEARACISKHQLGFSHVRLLPKETGVRPIVNLSRRIKSQNGSWRSINRILRGAFYILGYESTRHRESMTTSVQGLTGLHSRLTNFKMNLLKANGTIPPLYFVKMDIRACFDSIDQQKLLEIIAEIVKEERYMIQKYGRASAGLNGVRVEFSGNAVPETERNHFLFQARKLAKSLRHSIFVDRVVYDFEDREDVLELLREHITDNIVKIGQDFYRQTMGIPQGSVISTLLCNFFYGDLEKRKFKFSDDPQCLLMRLVDDYLLITSNLEKAQSFVRMMSNGHPEYGCFIAKEKTLRNFPADHFDIGTFFAREEINFPWCGNLININDLSVSVDHTRLRDIFMSDTMTVDRNRRQGSGLLLRMLHAVRQRAHAIYTDPALNSPTTLYTNMYQNMIICAVKLRYYIKALRINMALRERLIEKCIRQVVRFNWALLRRKWGARPELTRHDAFWLSYHAFASVMKRRPSGFAGIIRALNMELSVATYRDSRRRLRGVVHDAVSVFEGIAL